MNSVEALKELLSEQYGDYIRDTEFHETFLDALQVINTINIPKATGGQTDVFYLYLHQLIIELFNRVNKLEGDLLAKKQAIDSKL